MRLKNIMKVTPIATPKVVMTKNKIIEKFYNQGVLAIKSEFDKKSGKLLKDTFMNSEGTKPLRITLYGENEKVLKDTFFNANGKYLGTVDHTSLAENIDFVI